MLLKNKKYLILFLFLFFFTSISKLDAANLYIKPSQANVSAGNIVSVQVTVDTSSKVINNAESIIQFPTDLLEVVSLDSSSSIFSLWVEQPSYSNTAGQLVFNGGVPNPGYVGTNGRIISIIFRAKKAGTASLVFTNSAVRENDGLGTDILSNSIGATINIAEVNNAPVPVVIKNDSTSINPAVTVTSTTHPKQDLWYNNEGVELSWILQKNVTAVKTLLGSYPDSEPTVYYDTPIKGKSIKNLDNGVWYFHVNYLLNGNWSKVAHYRINIDKIGPTNLTINTTKDDSGKVTLEMKSEDTLSGIEYYKVVVDNDEPILVNSDSDGKASVVLPFSSVGNHNILVYAFDRAGNFAEGKTNVITDFISKLSIDSYPSKIKVYENINITGTAPYPYATLSVSIKNTDSIVETYKIKADSYSKFRFVSGEISNDGKYTLWVEALKENGEVSITSEKVNILVVKPLLLQVGSYTTELLSVLIPAMILLFVMLLLIYYGWHKFFGLRRHMKKDLKQIEDKIHNSFKILYAEATKQLNVLEKASKRRKLTAEEEDAINEIKSSIFEIDKFIEKQIKKVEEDNL